MRYGASSRHMGEPRPAAGVEPGLLAAGLAMALLLMAFGALTTKGGMRFLLRDIISNKTLFQRSDTDATTR